MPTEENCSLTALPRVRIVNPPRASNADLDVLYNIHSKSGFHFVEQRGQQSYRAAYYAMIEMRPGDPNVRRMRSTGSGTLKKQRPRTIISSGHKTPVEAASAAIAYFRAHYGDHWKEVVASMRVKPWLVARRPRLGGYVARVWVRGLATDVTLADVSEQYRKGLTMSQARERYIWPDAKTAYRMIQEFLKVRFEQHEILPRLHLWRPTKRKVTYAAAGSR